jgi:signal transduction histidine kinase
MTLDPAGDSHVASAAAEPDDTTILGTPRDGSLRPLFGVVALLFIAFPIINLFSTSADAVESVLVFIGTAVFAGLMLSTSPFLGVRVRPATGPQQAGSSAAPSIRRIAASTAAVLVLLAIAVTLSITYPNAGWFALFYYASTGASTIRSSRIAVPLMVIAGVLASLTFFSAERDVGGAVVQGLSVTIIGFTVYSAIAVRRTNRALVAARHELARLAVADERSRIARDLHDTLGHSLSVITLKSELAGRLIDEDPARAKAEMADVERVAREGDAPPLQIVAALRGDAIEQPALRTLLQATGTVPTLRRVDLTRLDQDGVRAMACRATGGIVSDERVAWLLAACEGVPALAESLLVEGVWERGGRAGPSAGRARFAGARLELISPEALLWLECLAVLRKSAQDADVAELTGLGAAATLLDRIAGLTLIVLGVQLNDATCRDAARAAASGDPSNATARATAIVSRANARSHGQIVSNFAMVGAANVNIISQPTPQMEMTTGTMVNPGGPIISRLWPPAAATSSARLAVSWPLMSARSGSAAAGSTMPGSGRDRTWMPRKWLAMAIRLRGARIAISLLAQAASGPQADGQIRPRPRALAAIAAGSVPATGAIVPSSESSPIATKSPSWSPGKAPSEAIRASAIGRS